MGIRTLLVGKEEEPQDDGCHGNELASVHATPGHLFPERHGHVPAVERQHGQQVEYPHEDVHGGEQHEQIAPVPLRRGLPGKTGRTDDAPHVGRSPGSPTQQVRDPPDPGGPEHVPQALHDGHGDVPRQSGPFDHAGEGVRSCVADDLRTHLDADATHHLAVHRRQDRHDRRFAQHALSEVRDPHGLAHSVPRDLHEVLRRVHQPPVQRHDLVARPQTRHEGRRGRAVQGLRDGGDLRMRTVSGRSVEDEHGCEQEHRDHEVRERPARHHDGALPNGLVGVGAAPIGDRRLLEGVHPRDAHVAAEEEELDPVLGLAPPHRPQARAESHEELLDPHPTRLRRHEVAGLVDHDDDDDRDEEQNPVQRLGHQWGERRAGTLLTAGGPR